MTPKKCAELVKEYMKYKTKKHIKAQIRKHEKIKNPNILEQWQLCTDYRSLCHVEGSDSEIYNLCKKCVFNVDKKASNAMNDPNFKFEIIYGNVYKKEVKQ